MINLREESKLMKKEKNKKLAKIKRVKLTIKQLPMHVKIVHQTNYFQQPKF